MTENSYKPPHRHLDGMAFENGQLVPVTMPELGELEPEERGAASAVLDLVCRGLCSALDGRPDGCRVRLGALAFLFGLFPTVSAAAEKLGIARSTMSEAVEAMRQRLLIPNKVPIGDGSNSAPEQQKGST